MFDTRWMRPPTVVSPLTPPLAGSVAPDVLAQRVPALVLLAVRVGDDPAGRGSRTGRRSVACAGQVGPEQERALEAVEQAGGARRCTGPRPIRRRSSARPGAWVLERGTVTAGHGEQADRRRRGGVEVEPELGLVEQGPIGGGLVDRGRPDGGRRAQAGGGRGEGVPHPLGAGDPVALVLEVVAGQDGGRAEQAGHRRDGGRLVPPLLEAAVERVEDRDADRAALGHQLTGDDGPVGEADGHGVERVAPAVGREVDARAARGRCRGPGSAPCRPPPRWRGWPCGGTVRR